jgi:hypothetical protein
VLFRRRKPLHERLAKEGGLVDAPIVLDPFARSALLEAGIHGVSRARQWDTVASTDAPGIRGDAVHFVALPDGTLVVDEDEPDGSLAPLADAVEATVEPPYRAEAVRRGDQVWAVAARRVRIVELPDVEGEELELTVHGGDRSLSIDGQRTFGGLPALEALFTGDAVARGQRIDGVLWEVRLDPL